MINRPPLKGSRVPSRLFSLISVSQVSCSGHTRQRWFEFVIIFWTSLFCPRAYRGLKSAEFVKALRTSSEKSKLVFGLFLSDSTTAVVGGERRAWLLFRPRR